MKSTHTAKFPTPSANTAAFQDALLAWYNANARPLPWRNLATPSQQAAYPIWLAEIMLQQTTVASALPYYHKFLAQYPTIQALAQAPLQDVLHLWQGLGYYRRAHFLHRCAQTLVKDYQGQFPTTAEQLIKLPGLGDYTAAAIASQAFHQPAAAIDGNVSRILARLYAFPQPIDTSKKQLLQLANALQHTSQPALWTNALMELGATVCTPKKPRCHQCPVSSFCAAYASNTPEKWPLRTPKNKIPTKHGTAYVIINQNNAILLRQRPTNGLLGGLFEVPHTGWEDTPFTPPTNAIANTQTALVKHTFSHFHLHLKVHTLHITTNQSQGYYSLQALPPLPTLMHKVIKAAIA